MQGGYCRYDNLLFITNLNVMQSLSTVSIFR